MATYPLKFRTERENGSCYTTVLGEGGRILSKRGVPETTANAEKLATIITVERILDKFDSPATAKVLPAYVAASLKMVHRLVSLRYKAMTSGNPADLANAQKVIEEAKNSNIKAVRALAAGISEYLK